jgi:hypothetical protein
MPIGARKFAIILAGLSLAGALGGAWAMASRVAAFNAESAKEMFVFQRVGVREFQYAGRPVAIRDTADPAGSVGVVVVYGADELALRATIPPGDAALPGLTRHADWLTVARFAARRGLSFDELQRKIEAGEITDRLVLIVREPRPGADPLTYGEVSRSDWSFSFHELLPEGGFSSQKLRFPESARSLRRRQAAAREHNRPIPERREDEIVSGTWQFDAALLTMPVGWLSAPGGGETPPSFRGDAMAAMGWTLPVTGISIMGLVGAGIALAVLRPGPHQLKTDQRF